jgi:hypothetical protein
LYIYDNNGHGYSRLPHYLTLEYVENTIGVDKRKSITLYFSIPSKAEHLVLRVKQDNRSEEEIFIKLMFDDENKYKAYGHFKSRIITPTLSEISELTDITASVTEIKNNKKVEGLILEYKKKMH